MPVLDAKALETDPDGVAFLRAVLRSTGGRTEPPSSFDRPRDSKPASEPPLRQGEVPLAPFPSEAPDLRVGAQV